MDIASILTLILIVASILTGGGIFVVSRRRSTRRRKEAEQNLLREELERNRQEETADRLKTEEKNRRWAEEILRRKAEEEARLLAEEEAARLKAGEDARRRVEEAARLKAEENARRQAEEEARLKAEEEARCLVEEATQLKAEEESRRQAEEAARLKAEEEARRLAEEAARLKAEEEARRLAEEAARLKAEEESHRQAEEVARLKAKEEAHRQAEEAARHKAEEVARIKAEKEARQIKSIKKGHLEPIKRGGRSRIQEKELRTKQEGNYSIKIEVVCWEKERQWHLGVEISDENHDLNDEIEVKQDNTTLDKATNQEYCWNLNNAFGKINLQLTDGETVDEVDLGENNKSYIIFKLSGENQKFGRRVTYTSIGAYLLIAPSNWVPDEPSWFSEEIVSIPSYRAYFFISEKTSGSKLAFNEPDGKTVIIPLKTQQFILKGNQLNDASEFGGPLFGTDPPYIQKLDLQNWNDVETVIVGEEGLGTKRWRKEFKPRQKEIIQSLPADLVERNIGWFFLRFYNSEQNLIESLDFRYARYINNIILPQFPLNLDKDGYKPAIVEISHDKNCCIRCSKDNLNDFQVDTLPDGTNITIFPNPGNDKSHWMVECENGKIGLTILIDRIWWEITDGKTPPSEWVDKPVSLSRNELSATSSKILRIRFPRRSWCDGVSIGFSKVRANFYQLKVMECILNIPLRELNDVEERNRVGTSVLKIWVNAQQRCHEISIANLSVSLICKICNKSFSDTKINSHLSSHLDEFVRHLNYDEMRTYLPNLPGIIYKCAYCNYYAGDSEDHITSAIEHHIELICKKVDRKSGPAKISFSVLSDVNEIRKNYDRNLPFIYKCKECGQVFRDVTDNDRKNHLVEKHRSLLFKYQ